MKKNVIILGAGGHAKVLIDCLHLQANVKILGILDIDPLLEGALVLGEKVLGDEALLNDFSADEVYLVNGIGSTRLPEKRKAIFEEFKSLGYSFLSVIHPTAYIADDVLLGEGVQIMAGSIIQPDCSIGKNVILNTRASIDHDCIIGDHVHIAPGVVCSGSVSVGENSHVGTSASIIQGITIGNNCLISAGSVLVNNVPPNCKVAGVPAKKV